MAQAKPAVGLVMGSDSDWSVLEAAYEMLRQLGVATEVAVASAHRTPDRVRQWAASAAERGLKVIIAGAGGAAHLPGVIASWTSLPVIGVPVAQGPGPDPSRPPAAPLGGLDALLSIVQMPPGIPVACVGINGAQNAALLAAQILALSDAALAERLAAFRRSQAERVAERERRLLQRLSGGSQGASSAPSGASAEPAGAPATTAGACATPAAASGPQEGASR